MIRTTPVTTISTTIDATTAKPRRSAQAEIRPVMPASSGREQHLQRHRPEEDRCLCAEVEAGQQAAGVQDVVGSRVKTRMAVASDAQRVSANSAGDSGRAR